MIIIREAQEKDYETACELEKEILKLHSEGRPDVYRNIGNPLPKERFDEILDSDNIEMFIAENTENNEIAAVSVVKLKTSGDNPIIVPQKIAYIDDICVKQEYRHAGIGRTLFEHIKAYAEKNYAGSVELKVWEFNEDALKFYENMGMTTKSRILEIKL